MTSGNTKFDTFAYENISVRSYGDTAVAIADIKAAGKAAGQNVAANIKATLVFHKTKDGLKVVSGQATPVAAPGAPPPPAPANANSAANKTASLIRTNRRPSTKIGGLLVSSRFVTFPLTQP